MAELTRLLISLPDIGKSVSIVLSPGDAIQACGDPDAFLLSFIKPAIAKLMAEYVDHLIKNQSEATTNDR